MKRWNGAGRGRAPSVTARCRVTSASVRPLSNRPRASRGTPAMVQVIRMAARRPASPNGSASRMRAGLGHLSEPTMTRNRSASTCCTEDALPDRTFREVGD